MPRPTIVRCELPDEPLLLLKPALGNACPPELVTGDSRLNDVVRQFSSFAEENRCPHKPLRIGLLVAACLSNSSFAFADEVLSDCPKVRPRTMTLRDAALVTSGAQKSFSLTLRRALRWHCRDM